MQILDSLHKGKFEIACTSDSL
uniref:Uncharacterized protein n=1 Tax=Rhizophora mucronata TaxID=61149 RepID=A0A2P2NQ36_RHIMU